MALATAVLASVPRAHAGDRDTVVAVMPVFSQVVAWRLPPGFVRTNEEAKAHHYLFEAVRRDESLDDWTQMVSLTGSAGLADYRESTPRAFANVLAMDFKQTCPDSYYGIELEPPAVEGHDTYAAVAGCGVVPGSKPAHGQTALIVVIEGTHDYYTVQWEEHSPAQSEPPRIDAHLWSQRLAQLMPIKVCDRVPGEKPPYPSCTSSIARQHQARTAAAPRPGHVIVPDTDAIVAGWEAAGFTLTLKHYLSTLASTCDSLPGASPASGESLLRAWQDRARNGVFLDASRLYQTAFVAAVQQARGKQAADRLLARQMALVRQQGDEEAKKLLAGKAAEEAETCRQVAADVAAGEYDITERVPFYPTLDRLVRDLSGEDRTDGRAP
jgi:hypothetical protein